MSTWRDLVTASLIGTERSVVPAVAIPGLPPAEDDPGDPAAVLLDRAALLTAARRAGRRPDHAEPLPACALDPRPAVSPAAARRLRRLIGGEHPDLLIEWLTAAVARGLLLPPQLLPALLDRARRSRPADQGLPGLLAEAGGPRARWLADLNPDWAHAVEEPSADDQTWRLGDASLPGSALGQRMAERALGYVRIEDTAQGRRLSVRAPSESQVLLEVLARTPLTTWTEGFDLSAAEVVGLPSGSWAPVMFTGWSRAAIAQDNRDWISALLSHALAGRPGTAAEIEALRQLARRADPALGAPGALPVSAGDPDLPPPIRDAVRLLRFRYEMLKELDDR